jgi:dynein heavy chain
MSGHNVEEFVRQAVESIRDIDQAVAAMHGNVEAMKHKIAEFTASDTLLPFHHQKGDKVQPELEIRKRFDEHIKNRRATMRQKEQEIKQLLNDTLNSINSLKRKCGFSEIQSTSSVWVSYVEYVNHVVADSLVESVKQSLRSLRDQLDPMWIEDNEGISLMEIRLDLSRPQQNNNNTAARTVRFIPNLNAAENALALPQQQPSLGATVTKGNKEKENQPASSYDINLEQYLNDFAHHVVDSVCSISRLEALEPSHNYMSFADNSGDISRLYGQISELIKANNEQCQQFLSTFAAFAPMYESDMKAEFKKFLNKNKKSQLSDENAGDEDAQQQQQQQQQTQDAASLDAVGGSENSEGEYFGLPLEEFHNAISNYERTQDDVNAIDERRVIGFLRVDAKPIRAALTDLCRRWKEMFSGHLMKKIQADLDALDKFIEQADQGLEEEVLDGNLESLKAVMRHVRDCRNRNRLVVGSDEDAPQSSGDDSSSNKKRRGMFPPIHEALLMLKSHPLSEADQAKVEELDELRKPAPDRWVNLNKKSLNVRAQNSIVQDREAEKIKEEVIEFEQGISRAADEFRRNQLFGADVPLDQVYVLIDAQASEFKKIELEGKALRELQELFDLTLNDFKELRECKLELTLLKQAWDLVIHIKLTFQDWLKSTFKMIDVDSFLDEIKRLLKQLKAQPHKVRGWDVYKGIVEEVNNMNTSLPLCAELRSDAMRERHWKLLLDTTHTSGNIEPDASDFTLEKLINLGLHRYAEDVSNIVEKANKEQFIERSLTKIIDIWEKLEISYNYNDQLSTNLLGSVEEVVEQLENDNNVLQSLLSNRFVEYFLERVTLWQKRLGLVESCIGKWVDIQRQWQNLHPIFMGPADIKGSLVDEVRLFNSADELFRAIMSKAQNYKNVVELICSDSIKKELNKDQELEEMLDYLARSLAECEKGLNRFLARKREVFARFFFVSAADLIDILSKGSEPKAVMVHMSKIIDSVDTFVFDENPNVNAAFKDAWKMVSIQGEEVKLISDYSCEGAVEDWLRGCVQIMKDTIKQAIQDAMSSYHEMKKTDWIHSHCCQAIIVARRIFFTADVHDASPPWKAVPAKPCASS